MNSREAAELLGFRREYALTAIRDGIELPVSKVVTKLVASPLGTDFDISESSLDDFILAFEMEVPGRHPPAEVRRRLLIEAGHRCAICRERGPIEFHHIIEFSELKHHDSKHMLAVCPTDHARCGTGEIDLKAQREYKRQLSLRDAPVNFRFSWDDFSTVIDSLHSTLSRRSRNRNDAASTDFVAISLIEKNRINGLGANYYKAMIELHEPYFMAIEEFLENPINQTARDTYFELVDEFKFKIAGARGSFDSFEELLISMADDAVSSSESMKGKRRVVNLLLSFMYFQCDIGVKE